MTSLVLFPLSFRAIMAANSESSDTVAANDSFKNYGPGGLRKLWDLPSWQPHRLGRDTWIFWSWGNQKFLRFGTKRLGESAVPISLDFFRLLDTRNREQQIRLVVGTINLVEKIAELAQIPMHDVRRLAESERLPLRKKAVYLFMDKNRSSLSDAEATDAPQQKQVIKEGLSEYFIYTIEGTETIRNGWSNRMRSFQGNSVPLKIKYRYRPKEYGDQLVRMYLMTNDKESKLGTTPLPDGAVRVFRSNGRDGLSYLTQQSIKYIPIGDKIELNLGPDSDVAFELENLRMSRNAISMQINGTNTYQQVGDDTTAAEVNSSVVGWDDHSVFRQRIRNYTDKAIDVDIRRSFDAQVVFRSQLRPKMHDYQTVEFGAQVAAGARQDLLYEILQHQGHNSQQMNVTIESTPVKL